MSRKWIYFLQDILDACHKIQAYTKGQDRDGFRASPQVYDAVVLNLLIIGEASKHVPDEAKQAMPEVEWSMAARFRDLVAHHYFVLDLDVVWDIVRQKVPPMEEAITRFLDARPPTEDAP
jgi:uncharacterized protein with HEPN domain